MGEEEKEQLLGKDEFRNFRILGLIHVALSGMIALIGLVYFCTIVALAGTDTNAPNMALVVLSTLSVCVALAGTAIVALKFRSTNTRLKCITAVFIGQTVLNLLLALLVIAMASASIPIAIETTAQVAVVVIPVLFLLFGVLTFAVGVLSLYAVFFRFPSTQRKKVPQRSCKVFTVSKTRGRTPSPPPLEGDHDSGEEAMEAYSASPKPQLRSREKAASGCGGGGASNGRERDVADKKASKGKASGMRRGGGADEQDADRGGRESDARPKPGGGNRTAEPIRASPGAAKSHDEQVLINVETLPSADSRTPASSHAGAGASSGSGRGAEGGEPSSEPSAEEK